LTDAGTLATGAVQRCGRCAGGMTARTGVAGAEMAVPLRQMVRARGARDPGTTKGDLHSIQDPSELRFCRELCCGCFLKFSCIAGFKLWVMNSSNERCFLRFVSSVQKRCLGLDGFVRLVGDRDRAHAAMLSSSAC
jgi:hypothetical protein